MWWTRQRGAAAIDTARRMRLDALIAHAREYSPLYRALYRDMPAAAPPLEQLPPVTKRQLMAGFDAWVTDSSITRSGVEAFLHDPELVGEQYLGRYAVWKSSGSTGEPGIFVHDANALATMLQQPQQL
jgi:phenylacetate-coenzyme A ligase PaaK-like adenylate-forming protein